MASVTDQITAAKTYTNMYQAETDTVTGAASTKLTQSDFLNLLTQQLEYQDPMEPMDNSQFVSQINQFSQLEAQTDISKTLNDSTTTQQATMLVGENVTLQDPDDKTKTITGTVTSALIDGDNSSIVVNGTSYPLSLLKKVNQVTTATTTGS